jgi:hypothetical protein
MGDPELVRLAYKVLEEHGVPWITDGALVANKKDDGARMFGTLAVPAAAGADDAGPEVVHAQAVRRDRPGRDLARRTDDRPARRRRSR